MDLPLLVFYKEQGSLLTKMSISLTLYSQGDKKEIMVMTADQHRM